MTKIKINTNKIVKASYVEGYNFSFIGKPKLTLICGNCNCKSSGRDYIPLNENKIHTTDVMFCIYCGMWNKLGVRCL